MPVDVSTDRRAWLPIGLFVAAPVIWSLHFMVVYLAVEAGCTGRGPGLRLLDPPAAALVTVAVTVAAAVACAATGAWGYRRWRALRSATGGDATGLEGPDHSGSLAFATVLLSVVGVIEIVFVGVPALVLPAC